MAGVYRMALDKMMTGTLDLTGGTATAYLVSAGYSPDLTTHGVTADVPTAARQASATVAGRAVSGGVFSASPTTFTAATGDPVKAVVVEVDGDLVAYVDDFGAGPGGTTLSLNGSDVTINWAPAGIVKLGA